MLCLVLCSTPYICCPGVGSCFPYDISTLDENESRQFLQNWLVFIGKVIFPEKEQDFFFLNPSYGNNYILEK